MQTHGLCLHLVVSFGMTFVVVTFNMAEIYQNALVSKGHDLSKAGLTSQIEYWLPYLNTSRQSYSGLKESFCNISKHTMATLLEKIVPL